MEPALIILPGVALILGANWIWEKLQKKRKTREKEAQEALREARRRREEEEKRQQAEWSEIRRRRAEEEEEQEATWRRKRERERRAEDEREIKRKLEEDERIEREIRDRARTAQMRGDAGERFLVNFMKGRLGADCRVLTDIYVQTEDGSITQIDCIVISRNGIFVIEVKNWACVVWGKAEEEFWTLSYKDGRKTRVKNPRKQNEWHTRAVKRYVGLLQEYVKSVIAFGDYAKFGLERPDDVMWIRDVPYYIKKADKEGVLPPLQESSKEFVARRLQEISDNISPQEKAEHVERQRAREYEEF